MRNSAAHSAAWEEMVGVWDLLLHGGRVIDPASGRDETADVAVRAGRIAAVEADLPPSGAAQAVDVSGRLVLPGLVDLHTHLWNGSTYWGLDAEPLAWRTGVTTWVDAGSAGAYAMEGLRRAVADPSPLRVHAMINVSGLGLVGRTGEHHVLDNLDVDAAVAVAARQGGLVRGVKARIDRHTVGEHGLEPLRRAAELARRLEQPLMVHIGYGPPDIADIAPFLTEGDILTHCATGVAADLVVDGKPADTLLRLRDSGVVFDLGHGSGAFDFDVLEAELAAGITPVISTDLHIRSVHGPAFDLPTVMGKALAAGMDLVEAGGGAPRRPPRPPPPSPSSPGAPCAGGASPWPRPGRAHLRALPGGGAGGPQAPPGAGAQAGSGRGQDASARVSAVVDATLAYDQARCDDLLRIPAHGDPALWWTQVVEPAWERVAQRTVLAGPGAVPEIVLATAALHALRDFTGAFEQARVAAGAPPANHPSRMRNIVLIFAAPDEVVPLSAHALAAALTAKGATVRIVTGPASAHRSVELVTMVRPAALVLATTQRRPELDVVHAVNEEFPDLPIIVGLRGDDAAGELPLSATVQRVRSFTAMLHEVLAVVG
jgi:dihydroorotase